VDFDEVEARKLPLLYEAAGNFLDRGLDDAEARRAVGSFEEFCRAEAAWLNDYALYAVLRRQFNTGAWTEWPEPLRRRDPQALAQAAAKHGRALARSRCCSLPFRQQWNQLRGCAANGIRILGDVAIFVNMDSADVWVHPGDLRAGRGPEADPHRRRAARLLFAHRPALGQSRSIAGTCWPRPTRGFDWWIDRIRRACQLYDIVRLDHFRGFEAYWAIPAEEETAVNGEWVKAPGLELFRALEAALGPLPLVAEDLGLITPKWTRCAWSWECRG
jgi:4-alpha-glucanotransferase